MHWCLHIMSDATFFWTPVRWTVIKNCCCLPVCLPVCQFGIFLRNGSLVFSDYFFLIIFKNWQRLFFEENSFFLQIWAERAQSGATCRYNFFQAFWKILSSVFPRNNLKWKLILLLIFHYQSHIWQNSDSWVLGQNAVHQSNCKIP